CRENLFGLELKLPFARANVPLERPDDEGAQSHAERQARHRMTKFMQGRDDKGEEDKDNDQASVPASGSEPSHPPEVSPKARGEDQDLSCLVDKVAGPIAWNSQALLAAYSGTGLLLLVRARKRNQPCHSDT